MSKSVAKHTRLAAYAWCEEGGRVLLCRVAPGERHAGRWMLPGGGLEFGEDPADAVRRELAEETGLEGRVDALAGIWSLSLEPHETVSGARVHLVGILYRVTPTGGTLRDERDGSTDRAAWIPVAELDALPRAERSSMGIVAWARDLTRR